MIVTGTILKEQAYRYIDFPKWRETWDGFRRANEQSPSILVIPGAAAHAMIPMADNAKVFTNLFGSQPGSRVIDYHYPRTMRESGPVVSYHDIMEHFAQAGFVALRVRREREDLLLVASPQLESVLQTYAARTGAELTNMPPLVEEGTRPLDILERWFPPLGMLKPFRAFPLQNEHFGMPRWVYAQVKSVIEGPLATPAPSEALATDHE